MALHRYKFEKAGSFKTMVSKITCVLIEIVYVSFMTISGKSGGLSHR